METTIIKTGDIVELTIVPTGIDDAPDNLRFAELIDKLNVKEAKVTRASWEGAGDESMSSKRLRLQFLLLPSETPNNSLGLNIKIEGKGTVTDGPTKLDDASADAEGQAAPTEGS